MMKKKNLCSLDMTIFEGNFRAPSCDPTNMYKCTCIYIFSFRWSHESALKIPIVNGILQLLSIHLIFVNFQFHWISNRLNCIFSVKRHMVRFIFVSFYLYQFSLVFSRPPFPVTKFLLCVTKLIKRGDILVVPLT